MLDFIIQNVHPFVADFGITASIITSVALTAASIAASAAQASAMADAKTNVNASAGGTRQAAKNLPKQRQMAATAQQGGTMLRPGFKEVSREDVQRKIDTLAQQVQSGNKAYDISAKSAQLDALRKQLANIPEDGKIYIRKSDGTYVPESTAMADFTGFGEADVQGKIATDYADLVNELGKKYGLAFVEEAKKQLEMADPEGTAARAKMGEMINAQANETPDRPVADLLDSQIAEQQASGRRLDPMMRDVLDASLQDAMNARGQAMGPGSVDQFAQPMETGLAGDARNQAALQKSTAWLASGATPEDVRFRREQQTLANMGAFIGGQTPQAQFQNLSGAQQGATPVMGGAPLPRMDQNAGVAAQQNYLQNWNTQLGFESTQANPWMAGLSSVISGAGALGKAGWKPLG